MCTYIYNVCLYSFEADRVWLFVEKTGTFTNDLIDNNTNKIIAKANGKTYQSSREVYSVSIDENGLIYKITANYIVDTSFNQGMKNTSYEYNVSYIII
jgi:hypothetical protein